MVRITEAMCSVRSGVATILMTGNHAPRKFSGAAGAAAAVPAASNALACSSAANILVEEAMVTVMVLVRLYGVDAYTPQQTCVRA